jgi:hypothetical protein
MLALALVASAASTVIAAPLGTEFVYQGYFEVESTHGNHKGRGPIPADGIYDIQFSLYDAEEGGTRVSGLITNNAVTVANGSFSTILDFGPVFDGGAKWLELSVRESGAGAFSTLSPRQAITATPYALYAARVDASGISGVLPGTVLGGTYTNAINFSNPANAFSGNGSGLTGVTAATLSGLYPNAVTFSNPSNIFSGDGAGLTRVNASTLGGMTASGFWSLAGNAGTTSANFLGTTDNQPLELRVNGQRAWRVEPNTTNSPNLIGGCSENYVDRAIGAVIVGGGSSDFPNSIFLSFQNAFVTAILYDTVVGGYRNSVSDANAATVVGGADNASRSVPYGLIGGGSGNSIRNGSHFTILGGSGNSINGAGIAKGSTIVGGAGNALAGDLCDWNTIVGGSTNAISYSQLSTISGGGGNQISGNSIAVTIGGGMANRAQAPYSTIGGGQANYVLDSGSTQPGDLHSHYSTIAGGSGNAVAGRYTTIGGGSGNQILADSSGYSLSTIAGGDRNLINSTQTGTISGGSGNRMMNAFSGTIGGGNANLAKSSFATVGGGNMNSALADNSTVAGGLRNIIDSTATGGCVPGGMGAKVSNFGEMAFASGSFGNAGDAQSSVMVCRRQVSGDVETELFLDGAQQRMLIQTNATWSFDILVSARAADGASAAYQLRGAVKNVGGTTTLVGPVEKTVLAAEVVGWDANVVADATHQALSVRVIGSAGVNTRWVASVRTVQLIY